MEGLGHSDNVDDHADGGDPQLRFGVCDREDGLGFRVEGLRVSSAYRVCLKVGITLEQEAESLR